MWNLLIACHAVQDCQRTYPTPPIFFEDRLALGIKHRVTEKQFLPQVVHRCSACQRSQSVWRIRSTCLEAYPAKVCLLCLLIPLGNVLLVPQARKWNVRNRAEERSIISNDFIYQGLIVREHSRENTSFLWVYGSCGRGLIKGLLMTSRVTWVDRWWFNIQ